MDHHRKRRNKNERDKLRQADASSKVLQYAGKSNNYFYYWYLFGFEQILFS